MRAVKWMTVLITALLTGSLLLGCDKQQQDVEQAASGPEPITIGFMATLSGPAAGLGEDLRDGFQLAIDHHGGQLGGHPVEVIIGDDQLKPDVGAQLARKFLQQDRVDAVVGIIFSNVMMAVARPITERDVFLISANAGPSQLAGDQCHENFFNVSWQNDQPHEAMGHYLKAQDVNRVYLMAPNYQAGKDALAGFKRYFLKENPDAEIVGEVYTKVNQPDYSAELTQLRQADPEAVFVFYPGGMGINFTKQYAQAGLMAEVPLYGQSFTFDQTTLPAIGEVAVGAINASFWDHSLDNPANAKFVEDFEQIYGRKASPYAAQAYDAGQLLHAAIAAVDGDLSDKAAFRAALREADFPSVRGDFRFNNNHFPIQDFYIREVVKTEDGSVGNQVIATALENHADAYHEQCAMQWSPAPAAE